MSDDLVERVAQAICETENGPCKCLPDECGCTYWRAHARAAIAIVLEEAARVAEGTRTEAAGNEYQSGKPGDFWDRDSIYGVGRDDCAAAIRSLVKEPQQ